MISPRSSRNSKKRHHPDQVTIQAVLTGAAALLRGASPSRELDTELLLAHVLQKPREYLLARRAEEVPPRTERRFSSLVRRRLEGVPVPYLAGTKEFYGRAFAVTPAVMIPRPESEDIVTEALTLLDTSDALHPIAAAVGTGSGALAVTIALDAPRARVLATDKSASALSVARRNARRHRVSRRVTFFESDLLTEIPPELSPHIIVANLPYVPTDELKHAGDSPDTAGLTFEPKSALDGGPDGLFAFRRFFAQLARMHEIRQTLRNLVLEHSPGERRRILELAHAVVPKFRPSEVSPFVTSWTKNR